MAFDDNKLDLIDIFVFDEEVDVHEGQHNESDVLESLKLPEIPSRYFAENSNSSSFQSSTGFLIGQEEKENKIQMMDWPELYENENINFAAENWGLKFTDEIHHRHHHRHRPVVESSVVVNDDSMNPILKSRPNNVNNEDDQGSGNDIIHENRLKRYKPSPSSSSSKGKSHLTVKPEKKIRPFTLKCFLCDYQPHCLERSICHKCGSIIIFTCRSCDYSCKKYTTIYKHCRTKHVIDQDRNIHCLYCDKNFVYSSLHRHYKKFHTIERKKEKNQKTIQFYILSKTADNEVYQCYKCKYSSSDRSDVKRHIRNEHDPIIQKPIDEPIKLPQQLQPTAVQEAKNTSADITPDFVSNEILDMLDLHCIDCNNMNSLDRVICDYCDWPNLQYHCRRCQRSPAMFASKMEGVEHVKKYHLHINNVCDNCGKNFARLKNFIDHKQYCLLVSDKK